MQMRLYKIKRSRINHIFISHLHGDHYFGLIGLLNSFALNNRQDELHLYAPEKLQYIIQLQMDAAGANLPYQLYFPHLEKEEIIFEDKKLSVECFKVKHRIECWGFIFREKKNPRKINVSAVKKYKVPKSFFENLHLGEDYVNSKNVLIKSRCDHSPPGRDLETRLRVSTGTLRVDCGRDRDNNWPRRCPCGFNTPNEGHQACPTRPSIA